MKLDIPEENMETKKLIDVPEMHWEIYEEWLRLGKPTMQCRSLNGVRWLTLDTEEPRWLTDLEYRILADQDTHPYTSRDAIPEKHLAVYDEWIRLGKPKLQFRASGPWTDIYTFPGWSPGVEYRIAEEPSAPAKKHMTASDQYWYKQGYQQALRDVREGLDKMVGERDVSCG